MAAAASGATNSNAEQFASHPYYEVMDDGLDLGMQGYLDMAQGMLIAPPPMACDPAVGGGEDDNDGEVQLWSYWSCAFELNLVWREEIACTA